MDITERLKDLRKQATEERSHYYVRSCVDESIKMIETLRKENLRLLKENEELAEKAWMYDDLCK